MLSKNAKVDAIRSVPLFAGCSKAELTQIAGLADELQFDAGRTLIREGERGSEFVVVLEGEVDVTRNGRKIARRGDHSFFGEIALVAGTPRTATVTTATQLRALVITDRAFDRLMRDSPQIQSKVLKSLAERLAGDAL